MQEDPRRTRPPDSTKKAHGGLQRLKQPSGSLHESDLELTQFWSESQVDKLRPTGWKEVACIEQNQKCPLIREIPVGVTWRSHAWVLQYMYNGWNPHHGLPTHLSTAPRILRGPLHQQLLISHHPITSCEAEASQPLLAPLGKGSPGTLLLSTHSALLTLVPHEHCAGVGRSKPDLCLQGSL